MRYIVRSLGIIIALLMVSCDCWVIIDGKVIDAETKLEIEGVQLQFLNVKSTKTSRVNGVKKVVKEIFLSDSIGQFIMVSDNYGFCPNVNPKIKIWKEGYQTKEFTVSKDQPNTELIIVLEKEPQKNITDTTNTLLPTIQTLELMYTVWGCNCPQWLETKDNKLEGKINHYFYLEPANVNVILPENFDPFLQNIRVKGQFYEREDYPKGSAEDEEPWPKAKVFRYLEYELLDKK